MHTFKMIIAQTTTHSPQQAGDYLTTIIIVSIISVAVIGIILSRKSKKAK